MEHKKSDTDTTEQKTSKKKSRSVAIPGTGKPHSFTESTTANDNKKPRKWCSIAFNMAAGFGVTAAAKVAVTTVATWASVPALGTLLASSLAVGLASTAWQRHSMKKSGQKVDDYWNKQNMKRLAKNSGWALVGGALFLGLDANWDRLFGTTPDTTPVATPTVTEPTVTEPPVAPPVPENTQVTPTPTEPPVAVVHCPSAMERFQELIAGQAVSDRVTDAMNRAGSDDVRLMAQGTKDLAYFAFNNFDGVPEAQAVALDLFRDAASNGNTQAKVDLLYIQYHGLAGVEANREAAMAAMQDIKGSAKAAWFAQAWAEAGTKAALGTTFDPDSIVKGAVNTHCRPAMPLP